MINFDQPISTYAIYNSSTIILSCIVVERFKREEIICIILLCNISTDGHRKLPECVIFLGYTNMHNLQSPEARKILIHLQISI